MNNPSINNINVPFPNDIMNANSAISDMSLINHGAHLLAFNPIMNPRPVNPIIQSVVNVANDQYVCISNLPPNFFEEDVKKAFNNYNLDVKVLKDIYNSESRRFGFIQFPTKEQALEFKNKYNYTVVKNFEIRMCIKKSKNEFNKDANIFIRNIPLTYSSKDLEKYCGQFGVIVSCAVRNNLNGESLGYGYVQFELTEAATKAIEAIKKAAEEEKSKPVDSATDPNNKKVGPMIAEVFMSRSNRINLNTNIYIKNFPTDNYNEAEKIVKEHFLNIGENNSHAVSQKEIDGKVCTYAFVAYATTELANLAIEKFNGKCIEGYENATPMTVCFVLPKAIRKAEMKKDPKNFINSSVIKNLCDTVTKENLIKVCEKYGMIKSVYLTEPIKIFPYGKISYNPLFKDQDITEETMVRMAIVKFENNEGFQAFNLMGAQDDRVLDLLTPSFDYGKEFIFNYQSKEELIKYNRVKQNMYRVGLLKSNKFNVSMDPRFSLNTNIPYNPLMMGGFQGYPPYNMISDSNYHTSTSVSSRPNEKESETGEVEHDLNWIKTHINELTSMNEEREEILGNLMYNTLLNKKYVEEQYIGKVTGMLIDSEIVTVQEFIQMMEDEKDLLARIQEAISMIKKDENGQEVVETE